MPLVTIRELTIAFRNEPLLDHVDCIIEEGQRIGLLGRNGSGKTTFMRLLSGMIEPDDGEIQLASDARVAILPQDVPQGVTGTITSIVTQGVILHKDAHEWEADQQVDQILSRMSLDGEARFETLSSGMKRRVLLAQALVSNPDLLLLDEPTNHLDIEAIIWLEGFLSRWNTSLIFVTHDRTFLRKLANRILELDRGRIFDWSCDYDTFLQRKEAALAAEEKQNALFDKKLAEEERWIRKGIKARRTRNEGRVRALKALRTERSQRRDKVGNVKLQIQQGERSGRLVAEAKNVSFAYDDNPIVSDFSTMIMREDKIGIIGPNGVGKTTLLRILLGELKPDSGSVRLGTNLQVAYFDQLRGQLDENQTIQENVGEGADSVMVEGNKRHIMGYLQDFLFTPERARTQIRYLSGGERNRVLLAKLFSKPANVLVLDEPTNDLDSETLELLEEKLADYQGTVLLVSHDRAFLDNVVTSTIVFEDGNVKEYAGGYEDWQRQKKANAAESTAPKVSRGEKQTAPLGMVAPPKAKQRKLSFKEQRELETLPATIDELETAIAAMHQLMGQPDFYQKPGEEIAKEQARLQELETKLATAFGRWEALEPFAG